MRSLAEIARHGMRVVAVLVLPATAFALTTPSITDLSNDTVETPRPPPAAAAPLVQARPAPSDNPLWGIPLKLLTNTRDRPIFSPSRRPPAPATVGPAPVVVAPPPKPKVPEQPQLSLLGTIVNGEDGYGIFMDQNSKVPVRIRIGASYQGWVLRSIKAGAATLEKDQDTAMLAFPRSAADAKGGVVRGLGVTGAIPTPPVKRSGNVQMPPDGPRTFPPPVGNALGVR